MSDVNIVKKNRRHWFGESEWVQANYYIALKAELAAANKRIAELELKNGIAVDALMSIAPYIPTSSAKSGGAMAKVGNVLAADKVRDAIVQCRPLADRL